jgi:outer membrane protein OmpA-like peptidoglycan-associated protein
MRSLHLILLAVIPALVILGCRHPKPVPQQAIQVEVSSSPGKATLFLGGRTLGETPQVLAVDTVDELLQMTATSENEQVVEKRIRFLSLDRAEVLFVFGADNSAMAKALGLAKILVFDYGAGVTFEVDKSDLKPAFLPLLDRQATLLNTHFSDQEAFVCGHTDSVGAPEHNLSLSLDRARAVADDLAGRGVAKERLKIQGFGSTYPLISNDTEAGRAMNRRTEVILPQ